MSMNFALEPRSTMSDYPPRTVTSGRVLMIGPKSSIPLSAIAV